MSRIAYVNGRYVSHGAARVHIEDRGYQFADGVYEVIYISGGALIDAGRHHDRLERSLRELRIPMPMARGPLGVVLGEVVRRNRVVDGIVYVQVTRGVAARDHAFPAAARPSLVVTARSMAGPSRTMAEEGIRVITMADQRWERCDIKTVSLLPNVLAKQAAKEAGAYEAWQIDDDGFVTEGSSTNAWIVDQDGRLRTRPLSSSILPGITRAAVMELIAETGLEALEQAFTLDEALNAREAFVTSTTSFVLAVTQIDDAVIGNGRAGALTRQLHERYLAHLGRATSAVAAE